MSRFRWKSAALSATCLMAWAISASAEVPAPSLSSPTNGATDQSTSLTLSWSSAVGSTSGQYEIQVSTTSNFNNDGSTSGLSDISGTSIALSSFTVAANPNTTSIPYYYWRGTSEDGNSTWSNAWSFTTLPAIPSLALPTNGAVNQPTSLTLSWNATTGAAMYNVMVSTSSSFATTFLSQTGLTTLSKSLSSLVNSATYYWEVAATDANGNTLGWSAPNSFTTIMAAPGSVTLSSPTNGATGQAVSLTLSWNSASNAASYTVQVSSGSDFTSTVSSQANLTGTSEAVSGLANSATYIWKVGATNAGGTTWSSVWSFTTAAAVIAAPGAPVLSSPTNGAMNQAITGLTLSWASNTSGGPVTSYAVQVGTSTTFSTTVLSMSGLTVTSEALPTLASNATYYWNVTATGPGGTSSASSLWSFTTAVAPGVPVLSSPTNGAMNQAVAGLTLSWTSGTGGPVTSYAVQVSTGSGFSSTVYSGSGLTATSQVLPTLVGGTTYYWDVSAMGPGGTTSATSARSFTTAPIPDMPTLSSPSNGATGVPIALSLSWTTSNNATSYAIQVSTISSFATTVWSASGLTGTTWDTAGTLVNLTVYYWRAGAKGLGGVSGWATPYSFTTVNGSSVLPVAAAMKLTKTEFAVKGASLVYSLSAAGEVGITFSDLLGRTALTMNRTQAAGHYTLALKEFALAEGRYIVQFKAAGIVKRQVVCIER